MRPVYERFRRHRPVTAVAPRLHRLASELGCPPCCALCVNDSRLDSVDQVVEEVRLVAGIRPVGRSDDPVGPGHPEQCSPVETVEAVEDVATRNPFSAAAEAVASAGPKTSLTRLRPSVTRLSVASLTRAT